MSSYQAPWGKIDQAERHHLAHHCADVAACLEGLLSLPVLRARLETAAGRSLTSTDIARLAVIGFLHDIGKLHPGFQAKGWPAEFWTKAKHGHIREGTAIFDGAKEKIARNLRIEAIRNWPGGLELVIAALAHHGRPVDLGDTAGRHGWEPVAAAGYDPVAASAEMGELIPRWFPEAFGPGGELPTAPVFQHLFCGLVSLADWLGSTRRIFDFVAELQPDYMSVARTKAAAAMTAVGLDARRWQTALVGTTDFESVAGFAPRAQQRLIGDLPLDALLAILEAETGSGKTEAALWHFIRLFAAGRVDSLYFALPTRAAALQIQRRIGRAMARLFKEDAPPTILAVPGYFRADDVDGEALPDWRVRWDDDGGLDERHLLARWAAESAKRYLAATISVGTVDQAMLAGLRVKHAHLRGSALSRSLLVIDEVHASDAWMTEIQASLVDAHVARGGHALLMSATLGSVARTRWLGRRRKLPSFEEAVSAPYPAIWTRGEAEPRALPPEEQATLGAKKVAMTLLPSWDARIVAERALEAARAGARVLVIRNTVTAALAAFEAVVSLGGADLLLSVNGRSTLHHSRFAREDRALLDAAVEAALTTQAKDRTPGGRIVIGSQTLEQSLDIDADLLITDLCPVDVLLQRIGRLHRHAHLPRPENYERPACLVLQPEVGLEPLLAPKFDNGLGGWMQDGVLMGIYRDLSILELTRRLVRDTPEWRIPEMNRYLVESATHPERVEALHNEPGPAWGKHHMLVSGKNVAEAGAARNKSLQTDLPFQDIGLFQDDEETIRTRLGAPGSRLVFDRPICGPFSVEIDDLTLPAHFSQGIEANAPTETIPDEDGWRLSVGKAEFRYDNLGCRRIPAKDE